MPTLSTSLSTLPAPHGFGPILPGMGPDLDGAERRGAGPKGARARRKDKVRAFFAPCPKTFRSGGVGKIQFFARVPT